VNSERHHNRTKGKGSLAPVLRSYDEVRNHTRSQKVGLVEGTIRLQLHRTAYTIQET